MLTLLIAAAVLAACTGLRRFLNREGRKDRTFWGGRIRLTALFEFCCRSAGKSKHQQLFVLNILQQQ